jgi:hypothetical protein
VWGKEIVVARKKKNPEGRNDVTLATSLAGITPRRKPKTPVSKKEAMVQMADDELTADIMTEAIHSPTSQLGLSSGVPMTRMLPGLTSAGFYAPKGASKTLKRLDFTGDKKFLKKDKEFIAIPAGRTMTPSEFRAVASHEYFHAGQERSLPSLGGRTSEAIARQRDLKSLDPPTRKRAREHLKSKYRKGSGPAIKGILSSVEKLSKKKLMKEGIYASPSKADNRTKTSSNKTLPPRKDRRDPSMGAVIASVADTMGSSIAAVPRGLYTWAKDPTKEGFVKGILKTDKVFRDSGKRAERRFHASQTNYPKKKRTKSKTKAVNTRLGGS